MSEEIGDWTENNIGQNLGTLGRHIEYWADIGQNLETLGSHMGYWEDTGQNLGTLGRPWTSL